MIDFIRIRFNNKELLETDLRDETKFKLITQLNYHDNEIIYPHKTNLENLEIIITEYAITIKNSLHKFYNIKNKNGNQNYTDFTYSNLRSVIKILNKNIVDLENAIITQIEFGINITTPKKASHYVKNNIIMHKYSPHNHSLNFKGKGEYKQFDYSNYYIKVYDKGKQYNLDENILRFEVKYIKKIEFNKIGVTTINDLLNKQYLRLFFTNLLKRFDELTIIDDFYNNSKLNKEDIKKIESFTNYIQWAHLKTRVKRNLLSKRKKEFKNILIERNLLTTKSTLRNLLINKFNYLIEH